MLSSRAGLCAPFPYRTCPAPFPSLVHRSIVRNIYGRRPTAISAATTDDLCTPTSHASPPEELFSSTAASVSVPAPISLRQWSFTDQHLFVLSSIACMTGAAVTGLFLTAIPTLMAFKRSAESLEKLLDVTREELPGTMAALRLSGLEISDLTMELSELGQEISLGVKRSARVVHAAQDGLRRVSNIATMAFLQDPMSTQIKVAKPETMMVKNLHESLVGMRMILRNVVTLKSSISWVWGFWKFLRNSKQQKWKYRETR